MQDQLSIRKRKILFRHLTCIPNIYGELIGYSYVVIFVLNVSVLLESTRSLLQASKRYFEELPRCFPF